MPIMPAAERQAAGHVVAVADVGDDAAGERTERVLDGEQVGEGLEGVGVVGEHVDDRDRRDGRHALQLVVLEHAGADDRVVAAEGAGHVLGRLAAVDADLVVADGDRVTAQLHDRHLHRVAGAGRRLLEHQRHAPPRQHLRRGRIGAARSRTARSSVGERSSISSR